MEKKEKPLEKLTAKELREMALELQTIQGVHGMKKEELIVAIRAAKGITEPEPKKEKRVVAKKEKVILSIAQLKQPAPIGPRPHAVFPVNQNTAHVWI